MHIHRREGLTYAYTQKRRINMHIQGRKKKINLLIYKEEVAFNLRIYKEEEAEDNEEA